MTFFFIIGLVINGHIVSGIVASLCLFAIFFFSIGIRHDVQEIMDKIGSPPVIPTVVIPIFLTSLKAFFAMLRGRSC